jgi:GT2 family glycosyltransferase
MSRDKALAPLWWLTSRSWMQPIMRPLRRLVGTERARRWKQSLRPRLHPSIHWHIDAVHRIDDVGAFVVGWLVDPCGEVARLELSCDGRTIDVTTRWARCRRPDVVASIADAPKTDVDVGFLCFLPDFLVSGVCSLRIVDRRGAVATQQVAAREATSAIEWSKEILSQVAAGRPDVADVIGRHVGPPLQALARRRAAPRPPLVREFGPRPARPRTSLLIPLYGRADFVRYQTALFASDPELRDVEILYVVDDPRLVETACDLARNAWRFHGVPLTVVVNERNLGFSGANNAGAAIARGATLVLLNSDVFPGRPGWLGRLLAPLADPRVGLVGAKLLYEDGTVQHDGMQLHAHEAWGGMPILLHPGKGLPDPGGGPAVADADAVTGACMAIRAADYRALGGLDEGYLLGDFEDSDLCLRVKRAGRSIRIVRDVELFHLERQSQWLMPDMEWRQKITIYNCWRHSLALQEAGR